MCRPPDVDGLDCITSNVDFAALPVGLSTPNANGAGCEMDDERDKRPIVPDNTGGIADCWPGITGMTG